MNCLGVIDYAWHKDFGLREGMDTNRIEMIVDIDKKEKKKKEEWNMDSLNRSIDTKGVKSHESSLSNTIHLIEEIDRCSCSFS